MRIQVTALLVLTCLAGCTKVLTQQLAHYRPGDAPTTRPVTREASYQVKVFHDGKYRGVNGTETFMHRGETLGFSTADDGAVQALTPRGSIRLQIPSGHKLIWYSRTEKQTQFGREFDKALAAAAATALVAGEVALVGAGLYLGAEYGDADDCDPPPHHHHPKDRDAPPIRK